MSSRSRLDLNPDHCLNILQCSQCLYSVPRGEPWKAGLGAEVKKEQRGKPYWKDSIFKILFLPISSLPAGHMILTTSNKHCFWSITPKGREEEKHKYLKETVRNHPRRAKSEFL